MKKKPPKKLPKKKSGTLSLNHIKLVDIGILLENCHWHLQSTIALIKKSRREINNFKVR